MNAIMRNYYPLFRHYQALRAQMLDMLTDTDLAFQVDGNPTLGALCHEIGNVEYSYIQSFTAGTHDFSYSDPRPELETSVAALREWYATLDGELEATIAALTDTNVHEKIIDRGGDFQLKPQQQLVVYQEALLIFYGKASVYLKALALPLTEQWREWIA